MDGFDYNEIAEALYLSETFKANNDFENAEVKPNVSLWRRPHDVPMEFEEKHDWNVFNDPQPSDIVQGYLGDCWLLSALALIAERPEVLLKIFQTKECNYYGIYQLRVCIDGEWKLITVDDCFPYVNGTFGFAFANGLKKQLWVPLVEKALAKNFGSFGALHGGYIDEGLEMLTGAPTKKFITENLTDDEEKQMLFSQLATAIEAGFIVGCSCGTFTTKDVNEQEYKQKGLVTRHAYSVLDVRQEGRHRNPWGSRRVWNGAWSSDWPFWDLNLKRRLLNDLPDGGFRMSFSDFLEYFSRVYVAKLRYGWKELRMSVRFGRVQCESDYCTRFRLQRRTEMCFVLYQKGIRRTTKKADIMICIHRVNFDGSLGELVCNSNRDYSSNVSIDDTFIEPGDYALICHSYCNFGTSKVDGVLAIHSSHEICARQSLCTGKMYAESIINFLLKRGKITTRCEGVTVKSVNKNFRGVFCMVENASKRVNCTGSQILSSRGTLKPSDVIPPNCREIVMIVTCQDSKTSACKSFNVSAAYVNHGVSCEPALVKGNQADLHFARML